MGEHISETKVSTYASSMRGALRQGKMGEAFWSLGKYFMFSREKTNVTCE